MSIFFSNKTALEFWRKYRLGVIAEPAATRCSPPSAPPNTKHMNEAIILGFSSPFHIIVSSANARKVSKRIVSHFQRIRFPHGSFLKIDERYFVSSPELCFFQMGSMLSFEEHVKLAFEFCGGYVLSPDSEKGFESCSPLTSVAKLFAFVKKMKGAHGKKRALKVLKYVENFANSPMETILTIMLVLPKKMGGFAFPMPKLNVKITPNRFVRGTAEKQCYYCDLYWNTARLAIEYDSNAYHIGSSRIAADSIRRSTLELMKIKVISVTFEQLKNAKETKKIALLLGKYLGKKMKQFESEFERKSLDLRRCLMPQYNNEAASWP